MGGQDGMVAAARTLLEAGPDALAGPATDAFVEQVARAHPAGATYREHTEQAVSQRKVDGDPAEIADGVYRNFIWTHFVTKLLMTAVPAVAVQAAAERVDLGEIRAAVASSGSVILSGFHYTGYPLVAMAAAMSPLAPLISKARVDVIERSESAGRLDEHVVYLSDRSAPIKMNRALKEGRSIWAMVDVVLPGARTIQVQFLGLGMDVGAGMGRIAQLSGRPCLPLFWAVDGGAVAVRTGPLVAAAETEQDFAQQFVSSQAEYVAEHPTQWTEWYSVLADAPRVRAEVKRGNEEIWSRLSQVLA